MSGGNEGRSARCFPLPLLASQSRRSDPIADVLRCVKESRYVLLGGHVSPLLLTHSTALSSLMCSDALSISSLTQVGTTFTMARRRRL